MKLCFVVLMSLLTKFSFAQNSSTEIKSQPIKVTPSFLSEGNFCNIRSATPNIEYVALMSSVGEILLSKIFTSAVNKFALRVNAKGNLLVKVVTKDGRSFVQQIMVQ